MTQERWQRVKELCALALECEPPRRGELLERLSGGDQGLMQEVQTMLAQSTASGDILQAPVWEQLGAVRTPWLPETIGRYRVLHLIGEGGMGAVYAAEQDHPRRTVALKIIRPGFTSPEVLWRFERESQALGRLQHPGIAQIYEAGTAETGLGTQPYFAMELVHGAALTEYAESQQISARKRLELIERISDAVEHAHQRGLIHRDLKPANVLVDGTGQPKILDFGVARLTDADAQRTRHTDMGQLVGTLAYMSPEQVLGDPLEVDTRSDVYALGVILYELLAGRLPYSTEGGLAEAIESIRQNEAEPLGSVNRDFQGDIETIARKAMEKDKKQRYASASALAEDIRRHLADEPIAARPPTLNYQVQKFVRRHKALVAGVAAVFVVLVAGIAVSTWQAVRARHAEIAAVAARQSAEAVSDFLQNDLLAQVSADGQAGPNRRPDPDIKVRTALDRASERIAGKFVNQPLVEVSLRKTIGRAYRQLGLYPEAQRQIEQALELGRRSLNRDSPQLLDIMDETAGIYWLQGRYALAEPLWRQIVDVRERISGPEHQATVTATNNLALLYSFQGKYRVAEPLLMRSLELQRKLSGPEHPETLSVMANLAQAYDGAGKYRQSETLFRETLEIRRRVSGEEHPDTLIVMNNLGAVYGNQGRYSEAGALYRKTLEVRRRILGEEHPNTLTVMNNLARLFLLEGKVDEAERMFVRLLEARRRVLGEDHPFTLMTVSNLSSVHRFNGRYQEAEAMLAKIVEVQRRVLGDGHRDTLVVTSNQAFLYLKQGRVEQARALHMRTLETLRREYGEDHPDTVSELERIGLTYYSDRDLARADEMFARVLAARRRVLSEQHPETLRARWLLGLTLVQARKFAEAERTLRGALDLYQQSGIDTWPRYICQNLLGASLAGLRRYSEAEPMAVGGFEGMIQRRSTIGAHEAYLLDEARNAVVQLYRDWDKPDKAAAWRGKASGARR